jgi:c-di-GMP-binding flagellar brake protein YcgR
MDLNDLQLKINQKIEIVEDNISYKSIIQDVRDKNLLIDMPTSDNKYYIMHVGSILEFYISTPGEIIKCRSNVVGRKIENNVQMAVLDLPQIIGRIQRREYFRLSITMAASYIMLPEEITFSRVNDIKLRYLDKMSKSITIDLSGGGARIVVKESITKGRMVLLSINIPEEVNVICKVIRVERDEVDKNYKVALRFENIDERTRDKIISFIFKKLRGQSKLLK